MSVFDDDFNDSWRDELDDEREQIRRARRAMGTITFLSSPYVAKSEDSNAQFAGVTTLSDEQAAAYKAIVEWLDACRKCQRGEALQKQVFALGGFAGVGKTALLGFLAADLTRKLRVAFCTPTGKAAGKFVGSAQKRSREADVTTSALLVRAANHSKP